MKFRESLIKSKNTNPNYDAKWGRFMPSRRFNVDQVPMPFVLDRNTTYESANVGRSDRVWVAQPGSGLDKRQCTLQVCFSPENNKTRIDIIFRSSSGGKRISEIEKHSYHKGVDIYWQKNAWADEDFSIKWIEKTLKNTTQDSDKEFLLLVDNLGCQNTQAFRKAVRKINGVVWYGVAGATDIWQPVDAGYGGLLKRKVGQIQEKWLEDDDNMNEWLGNSETKLSMSKRRILITHWVGEAHEELQKEDYKGFLWGCFMRTGCLLTADGSEDHLVKPEGLINYKPFPPLPNSGPNEASQEEVPSSEPPEDIIEPDLDENIEEEEPEALELEEEDCEKDRNFSDDIVGKKVRGLYEGSGWHTGTIKYYNTSLKKYLLQFDDGSTDFIKKEEIDGTELFLLDDPPRRNQRCQRVDYNALANGL